MANVLIANHNSFNLLKNSSDISDAFFPSQRNSMQ